MKHPKANPSAPQRAITDPSERYQYLTLAPYNTHPDVVTASYWYEQFPELTRADSHLYIMRFIQTLMCTPTYTDPVQLIEHCRYNNVPLMDVAKLCEQLAEPISILTSFSPIELHSVYTSFEAHLLASLYNLAPEKFGYYWTDTKWLHETGVTTKDMLKHVNTKLVNDAAANPHIANVWVTLYRWSTLASMQTYEQATQEVELVDGKRVTLDKLARRQQRAIDEKIKTEANTLYAAKLREWERAKRLRAERIEHLKANIRDYNELYMDHGETRKQLLADIAAFEKRLQGDNVTKEQKQEYKVQIGMLQMSLSSCDKSMATVQGNALDAKHEMTLKRNSKPAKPLKRDIVKKLQEEAQEEIDNFI